MDSQIENLIGSLQDQLTLKTKDFIVHQNYFSSLIQTLPSFLISLDNNKMMMLYFLIGGLKLIDEDFESLKIDKKLIIEWIYSHQSIFKDEENQKYNGFSSGPFLRYSQDLEENSYQRGHLVYTQTAICTLVMLGDDLNRINKSRIIQSLKYLQKENGSFNPYIDSYEQDIRFIYSTCVISYYLGDFSGFDQKKALEYILSCQNYDGGFGLQPNSESHGGACYCAIASLKLLGELDQIHNKNKLIFWLLNRQTNIQTEDGSLMGGIQGRINKMPDSCYTYWVGASLKILGYEHLLEADPIKLFLNECEYPQGGYLKDPINFMPDPVHSCFSLYGLSILKQQNLKEINPLFGIN